MAFVCKTRLSRLFLVSFLLFPLLVQANNYFVEVANEAGVHPSVLYAIAQVESTRPGLGKPWPWTVNFNGQGRWFDTKLEAMKAVDLALRSGLRNIDVGVMQVNLRWHGHRFNTLNEAFDPRRNIEVAAVILNEFSDDPVALQIARYHCPSKKCRKRALKYADKVIRRLNDH